MRLLRGRDSFLNCLKSFGHAANILRLQKLVRAQADQNGGKVDGQVTMFGALCDPSLPAQERTLDRLQDEGFSLISGDTDTTTGTLKICMFHLLNDRTLLLKLREELEQSPSGAWAEPEKLPYRVSHAVRREVYVDVEVHCVM